VALHGPAGPRDADATEERRPVGAFRYCGAKPRVRQRRYESFTKLSGKGSGRSLYEVRPTAGTLDSESSPVLAYGWVKARVDSHAHLTPRTRCRIQ
jgi:hypothetical protein